MYDIIAGDACVINIYRVAVIIYMYIYIYNNGRHMCYALQINIVLTTHDVMQVQRTADT